MKRHAAIIRAVTQSQVGSAVMTLEALEGHPPRFLILQRPPKNFDAVIGTEVEVTHQAVFILGELWAKRKRDNDKYILLSPKRRAT